MSVLAASSSIINVPLVPIVQSASLLKEQNGLVKSSSLNLGRLRPLNTKTEPIRLTVSKLRARSQPIAMIRPRRSSSIVCSAASNARCGAEQTQTVTREAPTITQAPTHTKEKSPQLDDGGTGFPPFDGGDGGGGGGGGGGNWSGGFFLFGFLAFLGFLKDKESEEDYNGNRRR